MGIKRIVLGPKSRHAVPPDIAAEVERVMDAALKDDFVDAALLAATPGEGLLGCACGAEHVPTRDRPFVDTKGTVHRAGLPCYAVCHVDDCDKDGRHHLDVRAEPSIEDRLAALEKCVTELLNRKCGCRRE